MQQATTPRVPIWLVVLEMDFCGRTFGTAPCLATGTKCFNTWPTCKYLSALNNVGKSYKFTNADAPIPFDGVRPYVKAVTLLPTEIKTSLTVTGRVTVEFHDEPDGDVGIDPYVRDRSAFPSIPGTFWKKFLARNKNYKRRLMKIYEGFLGDAEGAFVQRWIGKIENVTISRGVVKVEGVDLLKDLDSVMVPPKVDSKLAVAVTASYAGGLTLTSVADFASSGYVRIDDEIIGYASKDAATRQLLTLTRGYLTTAAAHTANTKVQPCRVYSGKPLDIAKTDMLSTDAGIAAGNIDATAFTYWKDWPSADIDFYRIISEPTKLGSLYAEIMDLCDCRSWVGEDLKITIRRNVPNQPGRSYTDLTDDVNVMEKTPAVDLNEKSRLTRVTVFWNKTVLGKSDEYKEYSRVEIAVDADSEGPLGYGDKIEKRLFCPWVTTATLQEELARNYVANLARRILARYRDAQPLVSMEMDLKDNSVKTGSYVWLSTDEVLLYDGNAIVQQIFQVTKREVKAGKIAVTLLRMSQRRICLIAPAGYPTYPNATAAQREYGFIAGADGKMSNGDPGYYVY